MNDEDVQNSNLLYPGKQIPGYNSPDPRSRIRVRMVDDHMYAMAHNGELGTIEDLGSPESGARSPNIHVIWDARLYVAVTCHTSRIEVIA